MPIKRTEQNPFYQDAFRNNPLYEEDANVIKENDAPKTLEKKHKGNRFNPFEIVRYDDSFKPDARTLNTSLRDKFKDTYNVWKGSSFINGPAGLLDYLTLGLFKLFGKIAKSVLQPSNYFEKKQQQTSWKKTFGALKYTTLIIATIIAFPSFCLSMLGTHVILPLIAVIITAACSPFIIFSHLVAKSVNAVGSKHAAQKIKLDEPMESSTQTLLDFMSDNHISLNNIRVEKVNTDIPNHFKFSASMKSVTATLNFTQYDLLKKHSVSARQLDGHSTEPRFGYMSQKRIMQ